MERSKFIALTGAFVAFGPRLIAAAYGVEGPARRMTLLTAPLELGGDWGGPALHSNASAVISRMRDACLSGIRLVSDRQPQNLRVDEHSSGPPHIRLHEEDTDTAWIVVDIAAGHWAQLAYQFGHELGHVLCNSWLPYSKLGPPCRWLEESMVEAFSIRGLQLLADGWERDPPFPHDAAYGKAIRKYYDDLIEKYRRGDEGESVTDVAAWFQANRATLDRANGLSKAEGPAIVSISIELDRDKGCVADMGAVNRWPALSAPPIEEYLRLWQNSCAEVGTSGILPTRLKKLLGLA